VHLVGFIIRVYHDARSSECQKKKSMFYSYWRVRITANSLCWQTAMKKLIFWNEESSKLEVECRDCNITKVWSPCCKCGCSYMMAHASWFRMCTSRSFCKYIFIQCHKLHSFGAGVAVLWFIWMKSLHVADNLHRKWNSVWATDFVVSVAPWFVFIKFAKFTLKMKKLY